MKQIFLIHENYQNIFASVISAIEMQLCDDRFNQIMAFSLYVFCK